MVAVPKFCVFHPHYGNRWFSAVLKMNKVYQLNNCNGRSDSSDLARTAPPRTKIANTKSLIHPHISCRLIFGYLVGGGIVVFYSVVIVEECFFGIEFQGLRSLEHLFWV